MAGLLDGVLGTLMNEQVVGQLAEKVGIDKSQAQSALSSGLPVLVQALGKKAATPDGESALTNLLPKGGDVLENVSGFLTEEKESEGNGLLDNLLGEKRSLVENAVSKDAGVSSGIVSKLLSAAAPMLLGALAGKAGSGGGLGSLLSGLTGEMQGSGSSGLLSLLDRDGDGEIMDDVVDMGKSLLGGMSK